MKLKALIKIRHNNIVYKAGEIIEVDSISKEKLIKEKAAELIEDNEFDKKENEEKNIKEMNISELKEYAKTLGLDLKGTKKEAIIQEIKEYKEGL